MESHHDITLEQIYVPAKHTKESYLCEDFIIYPDGKEQNGGYVLGIVEIRATPVEHSEKIIKTIVNSIKEKYYGQINASPDPSKLNLETIFEYALQKANETLSELIQISQINFDLSNLNYVIAAAKPRYKTRDIDFYFAQQGLINVSLLHRTKQNNYKLINIIDNTQAPAKESSDKIKFFSSTLSGKIYNHDTLFMATEIFSNYIPGHKVNKILSTNDLRTSIDYFKNLINNVKNNSYLTYCALFIKMEEKRASSEKPISQKSIAQLISTTERTEKFLTPTFALNLKESFLKIINLFKIKGRVKKLQELKHEKKLKFGFLKYLFNALKISFRLLIKLFNKITRRKSTSETGAANLKLPKGARKNFLSLRWLNKTIVIIIVVLIAILVTSIFYVKHRNQVKEEQAIYAEQIQTIKSQINDAQVNLIYKNENESLALIKTAEEAARYLPQATSGQQANYTELMSQISEIKNKLLHITKIVPQLMAEITVSGQPVQLASLERINDQIFVQAKSNTLFRIQEKQVFEIPSSAGDLYWSAQYDDQLLLVTNQNKVVELNANNLNPRSIDFGENLTVKNIALYGDNLYVLDNVNQQIFKFASADDGFRTRADWLKNKGEAVLTDAVDLAIDGSIYVATRQGQIYKFHGGDLESFELNQVEPVLGNVNHLYTGLDYNNLYLSDNKRIIVFDKEGRFLKQLHFESLDKQIADFTVNAEENQITFISGAKVYEASF